MNSKTSALNSWPWGSMLEQQVMIFMRQRWRTFRSASHSAAKLLVDPDCATIPKNTSAQIDVRVTTGDLDRRLLFFSTSGMEHGGMVPSNKLRSSNSCTSDMQFSILSGMVPDNWFPDRISWLRFAKLPTSVGSGPDNELTDKSKQLTTERVVAKNQILELAAVRKGSDEFPPLIIVRFQPVGSQVEISEMLQLPQIRRQISSKAICLKVNYCEGRKIGDRRWDSSTEFVGREVKNLHPGESISNFQTSCCILATRFPAWKGCTEIVEAHPRACYPRERGPEGLECCRAQVGSDPRAGLLTDQGTSRMRGYLVILLWHPSGRCCPMRGSEDLNTPREGVVAEVKRLQTRQVADACRDVPMEPVGAQVQGPQGGEVADGQGEDTGEPVGGQAQSHHLAAAARHALPAADAGGAVPGGQRTGVSASEPCLESKQSAGLVADAAVRCPGGEGHGNDDSDGGRKQAHELELSIGAGMEDLYGRRWRQSRLNKRHTRHLYSHDEQNKAISASR
ncbi:hypothetical protein U9M48_020778 [Paspalum notatum var. saurae]|uniref:Uncharacterized protein n=1 Tax=Paspalum notatum var. saurae TaxID=547442 RepID=A0AAQ3TEZ6_PASNO